MKKIQNLLLVVLGLVTALSLNAQNKPNTSTQPTPTINKVGDLPTISYSGTDKVNYVRTYDFYKAMTGTGSLATEIANNNVMQASQYFDGLGRPIQTVARKASGNGKDLVSFMIYDEYGRQVFAPMSYVQTSSTNGALQLTPSSSQNSFLNGQYAGEDIFYSKTDYEASPLNRVLKQMAPGNSWAGMGKGVSTEYLTNTSGEGIRLWSLGATPSTSTTYSAGELSKMVTTDENGSQVKEYTNQRGQVILKQVQKASSQAEAHNNWLSTYYLYDDYGNLTYVLPPRAVQLLRSNSWNWTNADIDELVFKYSYDGRNRMITKKVPDAGTVNMVYDKLDRLVLTQDANQAAAASNQWTFTKYDALGRPVMTGFITSSANRATMQSTVDSWTGVMHVAREGLTTADVVEGVTITTSNRDTGVDKYRTTTTGYIEYLPGFVTPANDSFETETTLDLSYNYTYYEGYHDATFPKLVDYVGNYEVNTVNFYDDYGFTSKAWSGDFSGFYGAGTQNAVTPSQHANVNGLATGSKVRVLGTDEFLTTVMFYDDRARVVQTQGDNHLGGTDITTTQYDFAGRVLHTYTKHNNPQAGTTRILKEFAYDHAGRLLTIKEKLNDTGGLKTLVSNSYNELGELESKELGDNLETLDYKYNVRGWLKSINGDELEAADHGTTMSNHYFAMDLSYDYGFTTNQLNGNIAGVKWKTKSSDQIKAYGFDYDKVNRLTEADYTQGSTWVNTVNDFSTTYSYDENGNILSLNRKSTIAGTITTIDNLTYHYGNGFASGGTTNQLLKVKDTAGDQGQGDFIDGNSSGNDYSYDDNGNMKDDLNKGISNINYNHLNLPTQVSFGSNKTISYTYDAAGIKLQKVVDDNGSITTTDYIAGFIYEENALQHFAHEEGRVRIEGGTNKYDYFIKDHLGNTRMTLTEARDSTVYDATMETALATFENSVFLNIDATRSDDYAFEGTESAKLGPESIGPAKMLMVSPGDTVNLSVYARYSDTFNSTQAGDTASIGQVLASLFGATGSGASVYEQGTYTALNNNAGTFLASTAQTGSSTVPLAYLNYIFFDQDFNLVTGASGFEQVNTNNQGKFDLIEANGLIMSEAGYLYVYVSNEGRTSDGGNVYFDALRINHKKGAVLQEDHYYPFGMNINALSSTAPLSKPNQFKYNGKEEQTEFDINWYDYGARNYDAQLGRWFNVDPLAENSISLTPYHYAANNPILIIDPDGRDTTYYSNNFEVENGMPVANRVVKGGEDVYYYQHEDGTYENGGSNYVQINSPYSIMGHDVSSDGTNGQLVNGYMSYLLNFLRDEDIFNASSTRVLIGASGYGRSELDIAYNGVLNDLATSEGSTLSSKYMGEDALDRIGKQDGREPTNYFTYSNALFKMGGKVYGNANEAGNYHIGIVFGFSNNGNPASLGDAYSRMKTGQPDAPHEVELVTSAYHLGIMLRHAVKHKDSEN